MAVTCDVCGGPLVIEADGKSAVCQSCGMRHSIERVREKAREGAAPAVSGSAPMSAEIQPAPAENGENDEFRLSVTYVMSVPMGALCVGGTVECGSIVKDETVTIFTADGIPKTAVVTAINTAPGQTGSSPRADAGEQVFCIVRGVSGRLNKHDIREGTVLIGHPVSARASHGGGGISAPAGKPGATPPAKAPEPIPAPEAVGTPVYDAQWAEIEEPEKGENPEND